RLKRAVKKIDISKTGVEVTSFEVTDQQKEQLGGRPDVFNCHYVILAIPPSVWPQVTITDGKDVNPQVEIGDMGKAPAIKHFTPLTERFWIKRGAAPYGGSTT